MPKGCSMDRPYKRPCHTSVDPVEQGAHSISAQDTMSGLAIHELSAAGGGLDFMCLLSDEVILHILLQLRLNDILRLSQVAVSWRRMAFDNALWRSLFISCFSKPSAGWLPDSNYLVRHEKNKRASLPTEPRHLWYRLYRIHHNWITGSYTSFRFPAGISTVPDKPRTFLPSLVAMADDWIFYPNWATESSGRQFIYTWNMSTLQNGPKTELGTVSLKAPQSSIVLLKAIKLLPTRTMLFVAVSDGSWLLFSVHVSGTLHLASTFFISGDVIDLEHRKAIVSVAFNDRVVCTFSEDYKISLFSYRPRQETVHIATLSGSKAGSPVDLHLTVTKGASFSWSGNPMFSLSVVCGSLVFGGGWEPYIQQVHFTDSRVVSSYQFFPSDLASHKPESRSFPSIYSTLKSSTPSCRSCNLAEDSTQPPSVRAYSMYWNPRLLSMEPIVHSFASISAISLAPPFVVCAHMDNSVQIYTFDYLYAKKLCECPTPETSLQQPKLVHVKTLYGHTSHVTAISLVKGRLITCASDGIKVWEIPDLHRQSMVFTSPNSSSLSQTPNVPGLSLSTILSSLPDDPVVTLMDLVSQRDFVDSSDSNYTTAAWVGVDSTRLVIHELRSTTTPMQRTLDDTDELCTPYPASSSKHALCQQQHILKVLNFS